MTLTAAGGSDATSGLAGYQYRVSVNGGAWRSPAPWYPAAIGIEGSSIVQFRSVDRAGNTSSWVPSVPGPDNTVNIDTTPPAVPTLTGASPLWQDVPSVTVNASGGADTSGSGFASFGYRLSTDGGTTWSPEVSGTGVTRIGGGLDAGALPKLRPGGQRVAVGHRPGHDRPRRSHRPGGQRRVAGLAERGVTAPDGGRI